MTTRNHTTDYIKLQMKFADELAFINLLVAQNGPNPEGYEALNSWYDNIGKMREAGTVSEEEVDFLRGVFGESYSTGKTMQGFVYTKPHGYNGDFEIIEKIYTKSLAKESHLCKWDKWMHTIAAPKAVRNRKTYFKNLLSSKFEKNSKVEVLNLASGPCRDLAEYNTENLDNRVHFTCIEMDKNAIDFAKNLTQNATNIDFIQKNIFRFSTEKKYDLIWSAGLFDYFEDKAFISLLQRFKSNINANGEMVIGNFHPRNPSRHTMEFGNWYLHHRDEEQLTKLAIQAGFSLSRIRIEAESEGVNLFMRLQV